MESFQIISLTTKGKFSHIFIYIFMKKRYFSLTFRIHIVSWWWCGVLWWWMGGFSVGLVVGDCWVQCKDEDVECFTPRSMLLWMSFLLPPILYTKCWGRMAIYWILKIVLFILRRMHMKAFESTGIKRPHIRPVW